MKKSRIYSTVDNLLGLINLKQIKAVDQGANAKISRFGEVFPLAEGLSGDGVVFFADATPECLDHPFDVSLYFANEESKEHGYTGEIVRIRELGRHEKRGFKFFPVVYEKSIAWLPAHKPGFAIVEKQFFGGRWRNGSPDLDAIPTKSSMYSGAGRTTFECLNGADLSEDFCRVLPAYMGVQFTKQFFWSVKIRDTVDSPVGLELLYSPKEIYSLFKNREKREGESRRKALLHLVSAHSRSLQSKDNDGDQYKAFVREHLRGANQFNWCGFAIKVKESLDDRKRLDRAMAI